MHSLAVALRTATVVVRNLFPRGSVLDAQAVRSVQFQDWRVLCYVGVM